MPTTTHQIEAHIERTCEALGSNLNELEQKVKSVLDWKEHFRNWPAASLGLAFGGGMVLAAILGGRGARRDGKPRLSRHPASAEPFMKSGRRSDGAHEAWNNVKSALISVAATRLLSLVADVIPGLGQKRERTQVEAIAAEPRTM